MFVKRCNVCHQPVGATRYTQQTFGTLDLVPKTAIQEVNTTIGGSPHNQQILHHTTLPLPPPLAFSLLLLPMPAEEGPFEYAALRRVIRPELSNPSLA